MRRPPLFGGRRSGPRGPLRGGLGTPAPRRYEVGRARNPLMRTPRDPIPWRRWLPQLIAAGSVVLVAALVLWLVRGDPLRVHHVTVEGAQVTDVQQVLAAAGLQGQSLFKLDSASAAERVRKVAGVKDVHVRRDWPRGAVIELTEQQGWGYWQAAGYSYVVDEQGHVLDRARPPGEGAPTIIMSGADQPLEPGAHVDADTIALVTRLLSDGTFGRLGVRPEAFEFQADRGLTVQVGGGPAAVFGDSHDYEFKVAAWAALLDRVQSGALKAKQFDLRFGRELVVR